MAWQQRHENGQLLNERIPIIQQASMAVFDRIVDILHRSSCLDRYRQALHISNHSENMNIEVGQREHVIKGLAIIPARTRVGEIGARRAIELVVPYLQREGLALYIAGNANLRTLIRSYASLMKRRVIRFDFVLFNAVGALQSRYARLMFTWARLCRLPVFVYWRELELMLETLSPEQQKRVEFFGTRDDIIHFTNSATTACYIQKRFPKIRSSLVSNCAFVPPEISECYTTLPAAPPYVVGIGGKDFIKGIDLFVATAIRVCQKHPSVEFIWLGRGQLQEELYNEIRLANLQSRILFPGLVENVAFVLRRASVYFMSSREESFSQATAEAMALGRQVVTFESGGPPELLGEFGTVIPNFDVDKAATAILEILNLPQEKLINEDLRARYLELYSPEQHAKRLSNAIRAHIKS